MCPQKVKKWPKKRSPLKENLNYLVWTTTKTKQRILFFYFASFFKKEINNWFWSARSWFSGIQNLFARNCCSNEKPKEIIELKNCWIYHLQFMIWRNKQILKIEVFTAQLLWNSRMLKNGKLCSQCGWWMNVFMALIMF